MPCVTYFDAQLQILDLLEHKAIFTAGYKAILHLHSLVEECEITRLLAQVNVKTKEKTKVRPRQAANTAGMEDLLTVCLQCFSAGSIQQTWMSLHLSFLR